MGDRWGDCLVNCICSAKLGIFLCRFPGGEYTRSVDEGFAGVSFVAPAYLKDRIAASAHRQWLYTKFESRGIMTKGATPQSVKCKKRNITKTVTRAVTSCALKCGTSFPASSNDVDM